MTLQSSYAQYFVLKGRLRDSMQKKDCSQAVVMLLRSDSSLAGFTRSQKDGSFVFRDIPAGGYKVLITHPSYSEYGNEILIRQGISTDLGMLMLQPRAEMLAPVIIIPRTMPPQMHGDTLEYNTAHIRTRENATVEELLVRLPGVQIDQNGNITINGKPIEHLLIDGKDFFGSDPTIVTRNFNADMIAKVQVFDKKSKLSEFTGVDDGQRTNTINLTLKEDSKQGYFVKSEAAGNPQEHYDVNGLLGSFKGDRQLAVLGMADDIGKTGFGGQGTGLSIEGATGDALGASAGAGIPKVIGAGMHYADKWNKDGHGAEGNYSYGHLSTRPFSINNIRQTLSDSIYKQQGVSSSMDVQEQHKIETEIDYVTDSLSAFHFSLGGMHLQGDNNFTSTGSSSFNDTLVNSSLRNIRSQVRNDNFRGLVMWRIRSGKKRNRSISLSAGMIRQDNSTKGYLYSLNSFYRPDGTLEHADTTDQRKIYSTRAIILNTGIFYREPLWKNAILNVNYGISFNRSRSLQSIYDNGNGKYDTYVDSLSNHYDNDIFTQRAIVWIQTSGRKLSYNVGQMSYRRRIRKRTK